MRSRLLALLLVPAVTILVLSRAVVNDANSAADDARELAALAVLAEQIAQVDQVLNEEALAGTEAIVRLEVWNELIEEEFARTDQSLAELRTLAAGESFSDSFGSELLTLLDRVEGNLERRVDIREGTISPLQLLNRYVTIREALIDSLNAQTQDVNSSESKDSLGGLIALIEARTAQLNERIAGELALTYGTWPPGQHSTTVSAVAIGEAHMEVALALRQQARDFTAQRPPALLSFRAQLLAGPTLPDVSRDRYVRASNAWLDVLNREIALEAASIAEDFQSAATNAENDRLATIAGVGLALAAATIIAGALGYRLVHRVSLITNRARAFANGTLIIDSDQTPVAGGDEIAALSEVFDDMARKVHVQANYDALTGLANRRTTLDSWHAWVNDAPAGSTAVFAIDLDGFKQINDRLGHQAGDETLREAAERFEHSTAHYSGLLGRLGGDEFVFIIRDLKSDTDLVEIAERLRSSLDPPVVRGRTNATVGASIGIARHRPNATAQQLLNDADNALYVAKAKGKNQVVESLPELRRRLDEKRTARDLILPALQANEFTPYFQPIWSGDGELVAFEALVRWCQTDGTILGPESFLEEVREKGAIHLLDAATLRAVCEMSAAWRSAGLFAVPVHVNVSPASIVQSGFVDTVKESLAVLNDAPRALVLGVTESELMSDLGGSAKRLGELQEIGVGIAVDDFGTGHSSLAYLRDLPVDTLKLDRVFIAGIHLDDTNQAIVRSVLTLANELAMSVVAEGVECEEEREWLTTHEVPRLQGHFLGRPVPEDEAAHMLRTAGAFGEENNSPRPAKPPQTRKETDHVLKRA